jgi:beta-lactam-binding protein with PASTA domain
VPRVVGLKLGQARLKIRRHYCGVGSITRRRSPRVGRVLRQTPRAGVKRRNYPIDLVVGRR